MYVTWWQNRPWTVRTFFFLLVVVSCRDVYANAYFVKLCFFFCSQRQINKCTLDVLLLRVRLLVLWCAGCLWTWFRVWDIIPFLVWTCTWLFIPVLVVLKMFKSTLNIFLVFVRRQFSKHDRPTAKKCLKYFNIVRNILHWRNDTWNEENNRLYFKRFYLIPRPPTAQERQCGFEQTCPPPSPQTRGSAASAMLQMKPSSSFWFDDCFLLKLCSVSWQ